MHLMFAGSNFFVFKKEAIDFILTDPVVKSFLEWSKDTLCPGSNMINLETELYSDRYIINLYLDEHIWATLQRYPQLPGYKPPHPKYDSNDFKSLARYVEWEGNQDRI